MIMLIKRKITLKKGEYVEAVSIKGSGKLLGIRCRCKGLSDASRFVRLIIYADDVCLFRRMLSDPKSVPALHIDHIAGINTLHWAIEANAIKPPWFSPLGLWGVIKHDKKLAEWDYFAYYTPSVKTSFTRSLSIIIHNPFDERVEVELRILLDKTNICSPYAHMLYYSYGVTLDPYKDVCLGRIEKSGIVDCIWVHVKIEEYLSHTYRIFSNLCKKFKKFNLCYKLLLKLLGKVMLKFSRDKFLYETALSSLGLIDLTHLINKLKEYYGLIVLPPDRIDFYITMPIFTLPYDNTLVSLKNASQYQLKVWVNIWLKTRQQ